MSFNIKALASIALALLVCAPAHADVAGNVHVARRVFLEKMATGGGQLDQIYAPNFVAHAASRDYNLEQDNAATQSWRMAMPDLKVTVERTVAEHDLVAVHWRAVGTNTVAVGGMPGDGARLGFEGMTLFRFAAGRIVEEWSVVDIATLRQELLPPAPGEHPGG